MAGSRASTLYGHCLRALPRLSRTSSPDLGTAQPARNRGQKVAQRLLWPYNDHVSLKRSSRCSTRRES